MKLYRFSPIDSKERLFEAIKHIHNNSYRLCLDSFAEALPNAGNIGVFCHYEKEYQDLISIRNRLVMPSNDPKQKYFKLLEPIVMAANGNIPAATYTHLYVRKPDIYRAQVGDIDFYIEPDQYKELKQFLLEGRELSGARIFPRNDLDMIELFNPDIDVLAYVSTSIMSQKVHIKLSEETNL